MACDDAISCREAVAMVQEFLDGELSEVPAEQVRAHFEACSRCYPHLRFERSFREALIRAGRGESAPAELKRRVEDLISGVAADGSSEGERS
ncbi:MAG: zf-HC2 domain-containing protein [Gemmatimonadota bacterium]|nr:zf-HC2 domain-containing protein [Gemmatimonadota bacterium]